MRYGLVIGTIVSIIIFILDAKAEKEKEKEKLQNRENIDKECNSNGKDEELKDE